MLHPIIPFIYYILPYCFHFHNRYFYCIYLLLFLFSHAIIFLSTPTSKGGVRMPTLNIPVGVSDFSEIRQNGYYYVDKMKLIRERTKHYETDRF